MTCHSIGVLHHPFYLLPPPEIPGPIRGFGAPVLPSDRTMTFTVQRVWSFRCWGPSIGDPPLDASWYLQDLQWFQGRWPDLSYLDRGSTRAIYSVPSTLIPLGSFWFLLDHGRGNKNNTHTELCRPGCCGGALPHQTEPPLPAGAGHCWGLTWRRKRWIWISSAQLPDGW